MSEDNHEIEGKYDPPDVCFGSKGAAIAPLLKWLEKWAHKRGYANPGIVHDEHFGSAALRWLDMFQAEQGLRVTNIFDDATRAKAKQMEGDLYFDFAEEASESGNDITEFIQPNGLSSLWWAPGCEPDYDREIIVAVYDRLTS